MIRVKDSFPLVEKQESTVSMSRSLTLTVYFPAFETEISARAPVSALSSSAYFFATTSCSVIIEILSLLNSRPKRSIP